MPPSPDHLTGPTGPGRDTPAAGPPGHRTRASAHPADRSDRGAARGPREPGRRFRPPRFARGRTVVGGVVVGALLLLVLGLLGGVGEPPGRPEAGIVPRSPDPLTAVQPRLQEALLEPADIAGMGVARASTRPAPGPADPPGAPVTPSAPVSPPGPPTPPATPPAPSTPEPSRHPEWDQWTELCRTLFDDPGALPGRWGHPPRRTTAQRLPRHDGTVQQVLSVFAEERADRAYGRLRETVGTCRRSATAMPDGRVIRVLAERTPDRRESAVADQTYLVELVVEDPRGRRSGWLALDRLGPVVSVLRVDAPGDTGGALTAPDIRRVALAKLRAVLTGLTSGEPTWPGRR